MNHLKFQQDFLTERAKGSVERNTVWCKKCDTAVALCLNAFVMVFVDNKDVLIDLSKFQRADGMERIIQRARTSNVEANLLTPTDEYRLYSRNRKVRMYNARAWRTGIDQTLLKYFDGATMKLYQLEENGTILITERGKGFEEAVGIVLPINLKAKQN